MKDKETLTTDIIFKSNELNKLLENVQMININWGLQILSIEYTDAVNNILRGYMKVTLVSFIKSSENDLGTAFYMLGMEMNKK